MTSGQTDRQVAGQLPKGAGVLGCWVMDNGLWSMGEGFGVEGSGLGSLEGTVVDRPGYWNASQY